MRQEPVYRGILGIDIERYSRAEWTDPLRARLRERLHRLVDDALAQAGVDPARTKRSDVGDGLWLLVASEVSTVRLIHPLMTDLVRGLVADNRLAPPAERMRLRLAFHAGEVLPDAHGETEPASSTPPGCWTPRLRGSSSPEAMKQPLWRWYPRSSTRES